MKLFIELARKSLGLILLLVFLFAQPGWTKAQVISTSPLTPLANLLNSDGTLNLRTNVNASLDPQGWQLVPRADGTPRFVPATPGSPQANPNDIYWDGRFGVPGTNWLVRALAVNGTDVYVGGQFAGAGNVLANGIAKWDGSQWSALGTGVSNGSGVNAIAVSGNNVYVGGNFGMTGDVKANLARWNGSTWSALGSGVDNTVYAIVVNGSDVYVGGDFMNAGGQPVNHIAKWDGTNWSALGSGVADHTLPAYSGTITAIAIDGSNIYVGGTFDTAGGQPASNIAKWDGSTWSALGSGVDDSVYALAVNSSTLYAGGRFITAGGNPASAIAQWDGSSWSAVGGGVSDVYTPQVRALLVNGTDLFVGGTFRAANGTPVNGIARWDGSNWSTLGSGVYAATSAPGEVWALAANSSRVYAGGAFTIAGGKPATNVAQWNGSTWSSLSNSQTNGVNGSNTVTTVNALAVSAGKVYVGGNFNAAGTTLANSIAMWNGTKWSPLGSGINGMVYAIAVNGNDVYVGGYFDSAGGHPANNIAKWNGSTWSALGRGVDYVVLALAVNGNTLYAGGKFKMAGGNPAHALAKWNGSTWSAVGGGVSGGGETQVTALLVNGNNLYVGGLFTRAGTLTTNNLAKWNGSNWSRVGGGVNGQVKALALSGTNLYVGGELTKAGQVAVSHIACWDGRNWSAMAGGLGWTVNALAVVGKNLFVGATQYLPPAGSYGTVWKWAGNKWSALGSALWGREVDAVMANGNDVYIGGAFIQTGNKASFNFGLWHDPTPLAAPTTPKLLAPANGAYLRTKSVLFDWSNSTSATSYNLQVRQGSTAGTLVVNVAPVASQYQAPNLVGGGKRYYWRVRACNLVGCSAWSPYWSLTIVP